MKKILAYLLTTAMALTLAAPAAFGAPKTAPAPAAPAMTEAAAELAETEKDMEPEDTAARLSSNKTAGGQAWEASTKMSLTREGTLRQEADMSVQEWDDAVAAKKQEGKDAPLTKEQILSADPDAQILEKDGTVYFIDQADALGEVTDALDAYRAAYSAAALMGGNELADLRLWHQMDIDDTRIYTFQQISDSRMNLGSTIKIAVNGNKISAVFSSLDPEAGKEENLVTQSGAEDVVRRMLAEAGEKAEVLPEYTDRIRYMPVVLDDLQLEDMDDDPVPEEMRWVVYSENTGDEEYPYLAHYLDLAGTYLESLPVEEPGDDEARCGFRKQKVFDGMIADTWTGEIRGEEDEARVVTLPVMRDEEGHWYLGDVNRRIAVADFFQAVYDDEHILDLIQSDDNASWDNEDLYMYYNYLNAWDFYADMGWIGPDGEDNDVIILKDICTGERIPYENACSLGMIQGWEMFGYTAYSQLGEPLRLGRGADVMSHEYAHTLTTTLMNSNLYENDPGAINEAMSDIMGNLAEYILKETDDTLWLLGENTGEVYRSMSDPEAYQQPAYVWDEFYGPATETPNDANDRGGVHINSSLLNRIAAKLCLEYGMTYEDAVRFWVMTAGGLTPETDYTQIPALLNWAVKESGNGDQAGNLNSLVEEEHLERTQIPDKLPVDRKIVHLDLPDTEAFEDENWSLMFVQLNTETIEKFGVSLFQLITQLMKDGADKEEIGRILSEYLNSIHLDGNRIQLDLKDDEDAVMDALTKTLLLSLGRLVEQGMAWRETPGGDIFFVTDNDPTAYVLINITESGTKVNGFSVLIGDRWIDLSPFLVFGEKLMGTKDGEENEAQSILSVLSEMTPEQFLKMAGTVFEIREAFFKAEEEATIGKKLPVEEILNYATAFLDYAFGDEEEKAEGILLDARVQELPTKGLGRISLRTE